MPLMFHVQMLEFRLEDKTIRYRQRYWRKAASTEQEILFSDVNALVVSYTRPRADDFERYYFRMHVSLQRFESELANAGSGWKALRQFAGALGHDTSEWRLDITHPLNTDDARESVEKLARFGGFKVIDRLEDEERVYFPGKELEGTSSSGPHSTTPDSVTSL